MNNERWRLALVTALFVTLLSACASPTIPGADDRPATAAPATPTPTATARPTPAPSPRAPATLAPTATPRPTAKATPRPTATASRTPSPAPASVLGREPTGPTQAATVLRVIDGDTIEVRIDGTAHRVRYIGIDTPETVHPSRPVEWMGPEASAANATLVGGKTVILEKDVSETDRYGRLLRYVWLQEGGAWLLVNLELLRRGLATVTTYPPDVKYVDGLYLPAQRQAEAAGLGIWGSGPPTSAPATSAPARGNCDASYPTVCIPPAPPDLDCGDIAHRRFTVAPPDPHRFDGNSDGVGCES